MMENFNSKTDRDVGNPNTSIRPISVNLVVTRKCNYKCVFCFGRLNDLEDEPSTDRILEIPAKLAYAGCEKITLEGGEPFIYENLRELIRVAKGTGLTTSIVTNGRLVTFEKLCELAENLDWLGLSIDSKIEKVEIKLGRGNGDHIKYCIQVAQWCHQLGINLKINTVVTSLNYKEDLTFLINKIKPKRWKAFQMLQINGENYSTINDLEIDDTEFKEFIKINKQNIDNGIEFVPEFAEDMVGSYIMLLPDGRFFSNHCKKHVFGTNTIFEVSVAEALNQVGWDYNKFYRRGGRYNWNIKKIKGGDDLSKKSKMTAKDASRIQSHADKTRTNQGFKERAQKAAAKNKK